MFRSKTFWQVVLGLLILALCIFFIRNEHLEVKRISEALGKANPFYVLTGIAVTVVYIFSQAFLYVESFASIRKKVNLTAALTLFLKRNLISVFLPAGGVSSLAFFTKEIERQNVHKSQIYFASYIYGICGMVSVILVAIPTLVYLLLKNTLTSTEIYAFVAVLAMVGTMGGAGYSLIKKGWIYMLAAKYFPSLVLVIDEFESSEFSIRHFIYSNLVSVFIEFIGIAHLYIAMLALGVHPSLELAFTGYVIMVVLLIVSPLLRGIGPIEVTLTYLFVQYGFSTEIAASVTLMFRFFEFWLPLFAGIFAFYNRRDNILLRVMPAALILILGIINITSAITPAIPERLEVIKTILSHNVIYVSNYFVILFGLILCVVSVYLLRGLRAAWWIAVFISALSAIGHISKAMDYEEATLAVFALFSLLISRKEYVLARDRSYQRKGLLNFTIVFVSVLIYGIVGFYFLDQRHFGINFNLKESFVSFLRFFFLFDTGDLIPKTHFANYFINSIYTFSIVTILFAFYTILRPYIIKPAVSPDELVSANELVHKFGNSSLDYFKTYRDKIFFFSDTVEGFVAFRTTSVFAIVLEKPVCSDRKNAEIIIQQFEEWCNKNGFKPLYYRVSEDDLALYFRKKFLKIGQEAIVDLTAFSLRGRDMKPMRNAVNRITAAGLEFRIYQPPVKEGVLQKLKQVSDEWLSANDRKELVFASGIFMPSILKHHLIFTVETREDKIVAFADQIPDYSKGEATYDVIRKSNDAPNGVIDFLLVKMFEYFKAQGFEKVNMGLAPMTGLDKNGTIAERTVRLAYENIRQFGHYKGLREFKEKFFPVWENKYLVYVNNYDLLSIPKALNDITKIDE